MIVHGRIGNERPGATNLSTRDNFRACCFPLSLSVPGSIANEGLFEFSYLFSDVLKLTFITGHGGPYRLLQALNLVSHMPGASSLLYERGAVFELQRSSLPTFSPYPVHICGGILQKTSESRTYPSAGYVFQLFGLGGPRNVMFEAQNFPPPQAQ